MKFSNRRTAFELLEQRTLFSLSFAPVISSTIPTDLVGPAYVADFNHNGKPDILLNTYDNNGLGTITLGTEILVNQGNGTFVPETGPAAPAGYTYRSIAIPADVNGDGLPDIVILATKKVGNDYSTIAISYINQGNGTFVASPTSAIFNNAVGPSLSPLVMDLNGDGKADLFISAGFAPQDSSEEDDFVFLGNGDGTFTFAHQYTDTNAGGTVFAGNFYNDGHTDVAVVNEGNLDITPLKGNGDGSFTPGTSESIGADFIFGDFLSAAGDFNGDGLTDFASVSNGLGETSSTATIWFCNGDGTFTAGPDLNLGSTAIGGVAAGDFTDDGKDDFLASPNVFVSNGDGSVQPAVTALTTSTYGGGVLAFDVTGDGKIDAVGVDTADGRLDVALNGAAQSGPTATTLNLTTTANTINQGQAPTVTATISPGSGPVPTGTITFFDGSMSLGTFNVQSGGTDSYTIPGLSVGVHSISATYSGDANYTGSTSNVVTETVNVIVQPAILANIEARMFSGVVIAGQPVHGMFVAELTNDFETTEKGKATIKVFASTDGAIDSSSILVTSQPYHVNLKVGHEILDRLLLKSLPLSAGTYTLLAETIDPAGNITDGTIGPTVQVQAPLISFSEVFTKLTIPKPLVSGAKTSAAATVAITNGGNITSTGSVTVSVYASLNGTNVGTFLNKAQKMVIKIGKTVTVKLALVRVPLGLNGGYTIAASVTDPDGQITGVNWQSVVNITA